MITVRLSEWMNWFGGVVPLYRRTIRWKRSPLNDHHPFLLTKILTAKLLTGKLFKISQNFDYRINVNG